MVQNSIDSAVGGKNERSLEALVMQSMGTIALDVPRTLSVASIAQSSFGLTDLFDGDASKRSSSMSKSNSHGDIVQSSQIDHKRAISKLALIRQQRSERLGKDNKRNHIDETNQTRRNIDETSQVKRHTRRRSTGNAEKERKRMDAELARKKMEEIYGPGGFPEANDSGDRTSNRDSTSKSDKMPYTPTKNKKVRKIRSNTSLSNYFSTPQGNRQRRISGGNMSIGTSSTMSTKKQSNSNQKKLSSVNDLVHNSAWADSVRKNSESFEKRIRRTPRNSHLRNKLDNHFPSTPKSDGSTKNARFARRRSSGDIGSLPKSDPGNRKQLRRKCRHSLNASVDLSSRSSNELASLASSVPISPKSPGAPPGSNVEGLVTPYNVLRDPKYKSSSQSYSDRLMIAAESSKTPMASLKKYLRDEKTEKMSTASVNSGNNSGPSKSISSGTSKSPRAGRRKRLPQSLLQIPFSDGNISKDDNDKRGDEETDNNKTALAVQAFGKSVAKTMKKQAKNTKRKIGKQISKMAPPNGMKSADSPFEYKAKIGTPLNHDPFDYFSDDEKNPDSSLIALKPPSGIVPEDEDDGIDSPIALKPPSGIIPDDPDSLTALKPPSGIVPEEEDGLNIPLKAPSGHCPRQESGFQTLKAPSGHCPRKESGFQETFPPPPLLSGSEVEGSPDLKSRKGIRGKVKRRSRQRRKSGSRKKYHEQLESPSENSFNEIFSDGDPSSSTQNGAFAEPAIVTSGSDQYPIFDDDDQDEDSTIERSYKMWNMNKKEYRSEQQQLDDGDSTIRDDDNMISSINTRDITIFNSNSFEQESMSTSRKKCPTFDPKTSSGKNVCNFNSSISTAITATTTAPTSPSITQSKHHSKKSYVNMNQHSNNELNTNTFTINEEDQTRRRNCTNKLDHKYGTDPIPSRNTEMKAKSLASEAALKKEASKAKPKDELSRQVGVSEKAVTKSGGLKAPQRTVSAELFDLLKNENTKNEKEKRRRELKDGARDRYYEQHKRDLKERRKQSQNFIDMAITVDSTDPLEVSEISNTHHRIARKKSPKPRRASLSQGSKNEDANSPGTPKDRKSSDRRSRTPVKNRRRGSRVKGRKRQDSSKTGSASDLFFEEKKDSASTLEM